MKNIHIYILLLISSLLMAQSSYGQVSLNDTRTFEVSASKPSKNRIISVWMEKRPERKDNDESAENMRVGYKSSSNNGKTWTEKGIIDLPNTFATGNPFITSNDKGETYLVCMHIGEDFNSGNISLYEFDFKTNQFNLKSIPIESDNRLLDKPAIVSSGNEIHLVYVSYEKKKNNSLKYQMSNDKGKTWTQAVDVFNDNTISYLGPSIAMTSEKQVVISTGSYRSNNIYVVKKKGGAVNTTFESPTVVSNVSNKLGAAMTELSIDKNGMIITWQNPHQKNETYLSYSVDEGNTWSEPYLATAEGNLLSAAFDNTGNIHCIYSDFSDEKFYVGYKLLNSNYKLLKKRNLMEPIPFSKFDEYLGAYQKLIVGKKELFAFWIDYPNNSTLKFTKWKNRIQ